MRFFSWNNKDKVMVITGDHMLMVILRKRPIRVLGDFIFRKLDKDEKRQSQLLLNSGLIPEDNTGLSTMEKNVIQKEILKKI